MKKQKDYSTEIERLEKKINDDYLFIGKYLAGIIIFIAVFFLITLIEDGRINDKLSSMPQRVCTNETQEFIIEKGEWFDFEQFSNYTHYSCMFNYTLIKCTLETCIIK